jgi:GGDEF domain-containing protein
VSEDQQNTSNESSNQGAQGIFHGPVTINQGVAYQQVLDSLEVLYRQQAELKVKLRDIEKRVAAYDVPQNVPVDYVESKQSLQEQLKETQTQIAQTRQQSRQILKADTATPAEISRTTSETTETDAVSSILEYRLEIMQRYINYVDQQICLVFIDLDGFTHINKHFGYQVGDRVIESISFILSKVREEHAEIHYQDWPSKNTRSAEVVQAFDALPVRVREGGDEFILYLRDTSLSEVAAIAERIQSLIRAYEWSDIASGLFVTASIGVAELQAHEAAHELVLRAIHGAIGVKRRGGNGVNKSPLAIAKERSRRLEDYFS